MMTNLTQLHAKLWRPGFASISATEAEYIGSHIAEQKPQLFVEIGTAAGLSTVMIQSVMKDYGGRLITVDYSEKFFGDRSKRTGFIVDEHFGDSAPVTRLTGVTSVELDGLIKDEIDMVFVDANHAHPWPTIDTLMVLPLLRRGGYMFHHDLFLYKQHADRRGIGPKYLFDALPDAHKQVIGDRHRNTFFLTNDIEVRDLERRLSDCLTMPWEGKIQFETARRIHERLLKHYHASVAASFVWALDRS